MLRNPIAWTRLVAQLVKTRGKGQFRPNEAKRRGIELLQGFFSRLDSFRVLDPACGSGNFLYLALKALRDIEKQIHIEAQELGLEPEIAMHSGPHNILGLEINEFAAELARVTVWIGDIQWCRRNGYAHAINPILKSLDGIEHRDALLKEDGSEAEWPTADVIVGNPPFLGDKVMRSELGSEYVDTLRRTYDGRVPGGADLVTYWFEKSRAQIEAGKLKAAGLVSTNSIRGGANRRVLDRIVDTTRIFEAWSDEAWVNDGAAVRVSLVGFGPIFQNGRESRLDGSNVAAIYADLTTGAGLDLTRAKNISENKNTCFVGTSKKASFDLSGGLARSWLSSPNPHGQPNYLVVKPWINGSDLVQRPSDTWIVDFGVKITEADAALFEKPFAHILETVKPEKMLVRAETEKRYWWLHARSAPEMRAAFKSETRYIATSIVAKHRLFVWKPVAVLPSHAVCVIARSDDATFGILHSRFHELWSLRLGTSLEDRPRYTPTTTFETFPFPAGLTPRDTAARSGEPSAPCMAADIVAANIAAAARRLNELREAWLNPPEWVDWVITPEEEKAGFPKRPVAKPGHEANLKKRTLTNLYNARPAWLDLAHKG